MPRAPRVGVLALQGDFAAHARMLEAIGADVREVRAPKTMRSLSGLVIPGGESTTLLRLMDYDQSWWPALGEFHEDGGALLGTCAGLILLAKEVTTPTQRSLGLLNVTVERNAYGRQRESFEATGQWSDGRPLEMVFIRAPAIQHSGNGVDVLATHGGDPVVVRQDRIIGATFHPELTNDDSLHRLFLQTCET